MFCGAPPLEFGECPVYVKKPLSSRCKLCGTSQRLHDERGDLAACNAPTAGGGGGGSAGTAAPVSALEQRGSAAAGATACVSASTTGDAKHQHRSGYTAAALDKENQASGVGFTSPPRTVTRGGDNGKTPDDSSLRSSAPQHQQQQPQQHQWVPRHYGHTHHDQRTPAAVVDLDSDLDLGPEEAPVAAASSSSGAAKQLARVPSEQPTLRHAGSSGSVTYAATEIMEGMFELTSSDAEEEPEPEIEADDAAQLAAQTETYTAPQPPSPPVQQAQVVQWADVVVSKVRHPASADASRKVLPIHANGEQPTSDTPASSGAVTSVSEVDEADDFALVGEQDDDFSPAVMDGGWRPLSSSSSSSLSVAADGATAVVQPMQKHHLRSAAVTTVSMVVSADEEKEDEEDDDEGENQWAASADPAGAVRAAGLPTGTTISAPAVAATAFATTFVPLTQPQLATFRSKLLREWDTRLRSVVASEPYVRVVAALSACLRVGAGACFTRHVCSLHTHT
jgi:hypothetical protein